MQPVTVNAGTRLEVSYVLSRAQAPVSERVIVVHHGICHTWCHFRRLIRTLNRMGFHVAAIDQQSERARLRNFIGLDSYAEGMAAAVREIEKHLPVGCYVLHSMGALIGEEMQQRYPGLRRPTVLMAPIPVDGALATTLRILRRYPFAYLRAVVTLDIRSLADSIRRFRALFFDEHTPPRIVRAARAMLKHAPFWSYCQLVLRRLVRPRIANSDQPKILLYSEADGIFEPREYAKTIDRFSLPEPIAIPGGHDFFIQYAQQAAEHIATFHQENLIRVHAAHARVPASLGKLSGAESRAERSSGTQAANE